MGFQQHITPNDRLIKFDDAQGLQFSIALVLIMYCISIPGAKYCIGIVLLANRLILSYGHFYQLTISFFINIFIICFNIITRSSL